MSLLKSPIIQYAYFVNDVDAAIKRWVNMFGAGPFLKIAHWDGARDHYYRGQPTTEDLTHAHGQCGAVQIQLTQQHNDLPSIWRDMYPAGEEGFHHVAIMVDDYDAERARLIKAGCEVGEEFYYDTGVEHLGIKDANVPARGRVVYLDARPLIGCFVEILERNSVIQYEFDAVRRLHEEWDGSGDPVRTSV